jgi:organic radical activating enzyme
MSDTFKKLFLGYAEFYITHVCNLTCEGCNRFNNVKFKGWQAWKDYESIYQEWSEQLTLGTVSILGGEPLLNPTFYDWVSGIRKLWPNSEIRIASNGTQLSRHKALYDVLKNDPLLTFSVCLHNKTTKKELMQDVHNFLKGPIVTTGDIVPYREHLTLTDSNGVKVHVWHNWWFHQGAVVTNPETGRFTLHQSDPIKAHEICHSKTCHHFENGMLHKCGPSSLFTQFDKQFNLELTDEDRTMIESYQPLRITDSIESKKLFLENIANPIDLCKFCPEEYHGKQIFALDKKIAFQRKSA